MPAQQTLTAAARLVAAEEAWLRVMGAMAEFHVAGAQGRHSDAESKAEEILANLEACLDQFAAAYRMTGPSNGSA